MMILLLILAIGAALGTFIENDFGSVTAKELVYHNYWYLLVLLLTAINIILIVIKTKMYRIKTRALFHIAFVIILIGAALTHYFGIDGQMNIREGQKTNIVMIGDESMELPFDVLLKKFDLIRYPGSGSPSEFKSQLTIIDERNHVSFDANVYMNNTLSYKGYKFFQTSYDTDEGGTILSVNADPGVHITYLGYAMLFLGLILSLFDKKSRFRFLLRRIKETYIVSVFIPLMFITFSTVTVGQEVYSEYVNTYLNDHRFQSKELALEFGSLVVQGPDGRMKPLDTQNREVLNKLSGKSSWEGMTANQVALGVFSRPKIWKKVQIIKVKTPRLRKILGLSDKQKLASFTNFFDDAGVYKLTDEIERANKLVPSKRGTYERDLIKVDERLNIFFMLYRGVLFTIFPLQNSENNQWVDFKNTLENSSDRSLRNNISRFLDAAYNRNYNKGIPHIEEIKNYQLEYGISIIPDQKRLDAEVWFNSIYLFNKLFVFYLLFGFFLLFLGFSSMLSNKPFGRKMAIIIWLIALVSLMINVFGIGIRWYIGGFAPLSSTYETMIYIAFSAITAGIVFLRKSIIALAASFIMAGIFIFAAYLGEVDPEITNLVPVLKSYWLSIHVSVITASYGFFGVAAILGIVNLFLFILRNKKRLHIDIHIKNIAYYIEITLILGLVLLVIGNFLGAIWANESWGRYWGWDPKETWAYISIIVYTIVLHLHLLKKIYSTYLFSVLTVLAFFSILMTYFGVNFYLAGLHSYATGDPIPIPEWVYYMVGMMLVLIAVSFKKKDINKIK